MLLISLKKCRHHYDNAIVQLTVLAVWYGLHLLPQIDWCCEHHMNIINIQTPKYHNNSVVFIPWEHIFSHYLLGTILVDYIVLQELRNSGNWLQECFEVNAAHLINQSVHDKHAESGSLSDDPWGCIWLAFQTNANSCIPKTVNCLPKTWNR